MTMTMQQTFDKVVTHLLTQGRRASSAKYGCAYRAGDNLSCAVGCLISDEAYTPELEGSNVGADIVREAMIASGLDLFDLVDIHIARCDTFYGRLQEIHDHHDVDGWADRLREFAVGRNLEFNPPATEP